MRYVRHYSVPILALALLAVACGPDEPLDADLYAYPGDADADGGEVVSDNVERVVIDPHDFSLEFWFDVHPRQAEAECRLQDDDQDTDWFECDSPLSLGPDSDLHDVQEGYLLFDVRAVEGEDDDRELGEPESIETLILFDFDFWLEDLDEFDIADPQFGFPDEYNATCTRNANYDGEFTPDDEYVPDDCEASCQWVSDEFHEPQSVDCSFDEPFDVEFPDENIENAYLEIEACATEFGGDADDEYCNGPKSYLFYPSPAEWEQLSAGERHVCGIIEDGTLWCWGRNNAGQVGTGDGDSPGAATEIGTDVTGWKDVSAGYEHTCAIDGEGVLYCWGEHTDGQLGRDGLNDVDEPEPVNDEHDWEIVAAGGAHSCAINDNSELYCWGSNNRGQLGIDEETSSASTPQLVSDHEWLDVTAGEEHTCGIRIREDNNVPFGYCWGDGGAGRLGNTETSGQFHAPEEINTTDAFEFTTGTLSAGEEHTCGVINDDAYCWGEGEEGQLGYEDDAPEFRHYPERIENPGGYIAMTAGTDHSCGVDTDGTPHCWGRNHSGHLGDGTRDRSNIPVAVDVPDDESFVDVTAGDEFSCGIDEHGVAYCWGNTSNGRLGVDDTGANTLDSATEIAWPQGRLIPTPEADEGENGDEDTDENDD